MQRWPSASALAGTEEQATSVIPLVLIPQLLFAGALVPVASMSAPVQAVSTAVFARWSFAGAGGTIDIDGRIAADPVLSRADRFGSDFFAIAPGQTLLLMLGFAMALAVVTALVLMRRRYA